jgi:predicted Rossmann fold flavoprotein
MRVYDGGKKHIYEDFGELLFTHFGISGPLTLSASAHMRDFGKKQYHVTLDLKPALDEATLDRRILRDFQKFTNRDFANSLGELSNRLMIPVLIARSGIDPATKVHSITREQRAALVSLFKSFRIDITAPRPIDEAIITSGGVSTREIVPATMESKLVRGVHFAGEVLDADAYTGGYNLQIAWATGYAAGLYAGETVTSE